MNTHDLPRYAVILAAGDGIRFGGDEPKQFIRLGGVPIFIRTLRLFHDSRIFHEILLVTNPKFLEPTRTLVKEYFSDSEVRIVLGGPSRTASVGLALAALDGQSDGLVVIHDAVRPFLNMQVIMNGIRVMQDESVDGVDTVIPSSDTLAKIDPISKQIREVLERSEFLRSQTPRFFVLSKIKQAFEKMRDSRIEFTEECGLLLAVYPKSRILCIDGSEKNIKITTKQDLVLAHNLLKAPSEKRLPD